MSYRSMGNLRWRLLPDDRVGYPAHRSGILPEFGMLLRESPEWT